MVNIRETLSKNKKFFSYFFICIFFILVFTTILFFIYSIYYILFLSPLIVAIVETVLVIHFKFRNRFVRYNSAISAFIGLFSLFSVITKMILDNFTTLAFPEFFGVVIVWMLIPAFVYMISAIYLTYGFSYFISKPLPSNQLIRENTIAFRYEKENDAVLNIINNLILNNLSYAPKRKSINEQNRYYRIFPFLQTSECLFAYVNKQSKKVFLLPLKLSEFLYYEIVPKEAKRIRDIFEELTSFNFQTDIDDKEIEDLTYYYNEATKPILDVGKLNRRKVGAGILIIFIISIIIALYLSRNVILNKLNSKNLTLMDAIIVGVVIVILSNSPKCIKFFKGLINENK